MLLASAALANPWLPMTSATPGRGSALPTPKEVPGKDFSDIRDRDLNGVPDSEQVVAWDGLGGVRDAFDYSGSRLAYPDVANDMQVDAISAGGDALFQALRDDQSNLLFSVRTPAAVVDQIYYVRPTNVPNPIPGFGVWATAADIDAMNLPLDLDGLEIWGGDNLDDSDRYSLADDPFTFDTVVPMEGRKVAIWQYNSGAHTSVHHTLTTDLAASIDMLLGGIGEGGIYWGQLVELMDVDAMMTFGAKVTFSIEQLTINLPGGGMFDFDGGEIFEYDGPGLPARYLEQGGYTWNTALDIMGTFGVPSEDIDGLEAASTPEPGSFALALFGLIAAVCIVRRRR
jgi:hypothetical protein